MFCHIKLMTRSEITNRSKYHDKYKILDPKFVLIAMITPTNKANFESTIGLFYNKGDSNIYYYKIKDGYVKGEKWRPRLFKGVTKQNFKRVIDSYCKSGSVNSVFNKIAEAEVLVDTILEQGYSVNVAISNLNGNSDVEWTDCFNRRCKGQTNDYERKECKAQCQWRALNLLISKLNAQRSRCRQTTNPNACIKTLQNSVDSTREKQRKVREEIAKIRSMAAEFRRKEAQRT